MKRFSFLRFLLLTCLLTAATLFHFSLHANAAPQFPVKAVVAKNANLRQGPGTTFAVSGNKRAGDSLTLVACNNECNWYQLDSGQWIAGFLVKLQQTASPPTPAGPKGAQACDSAYPDFCIPPLSAAGRDLDCRDIGKQDFSVITHPDPHNLDGDSDGLGCESNAASAGSTSAASVPAASLAPVAPVAPAAPVAAAPANNSQCDPSYPGVCIASYSVVGDLDCGEIPYRRFEVLDPDPHGFDRDNDGIGCES